VRPPSGSRSANVTAVPGPQTAPVALPAEIDVSNGSLAGAALSSALTGSQTGLAADGGGTAFCDARALPRRLALTARQLPPGRSCLAVIASAAQLANICLTALILIAVTPDQRASWLPSSAPPAHGTLTRLRSPGRSVAARPGTSPIARA